MPEQKEVPYIVVEKGGSSLGAFLWGAAVGAAVALLFAPRSGEETQRELKEGAKRLKKEAEGKFAELRESVEEGYDKLRSDVTERVGQARHEVQERKRQAEEALKAGKEAARRAREDLEKRVSETKAAYRAEAKREASQSPEAS